MEQAYDAILVVGFGGPEKKEDVLPFLENVTRGRNIPRERLLEVATHYYHFNGVSPINEQVRELIAALRDELVRHGICLPVYWGNRNWHPMLADTMREMKAQGVRRAVGLVLAGFSSYSSCRQYLENIAGARAAAGEDAPAVDKIRVWYNHPGFIAANADRLREALESLPPAARATARIVYSAHSLPVSMAAGCDYERQLRESCRLVSESLGLPPERWALVWQSRSGRPGDQWLEPDIVDYLKKARQEGLADAVVLPIGFVSDNVEVLYDLDDEARKACDETGLRMVRAKTVGTHPEFVAMLRELIQERLPGGTVRRAIGRYGPNHDVCPEDCCPAPAPGGRPGATRPPA